MRAYGCCWWWWYKGRASGQGGGEGPGAPRSLHSLAHPSTLPPSLVPRPPSPSRPGPSTAPFTGPPPFTAPANAPPPTGRRTRPRPRTTPAGEQVTLRLSPPPAPVALEHACPPAPPKPSPRTYWVLAPQLEMAMPPHQAAKHILTTLPRVRLAPGPLLLWFTPIPASSLTRNFGLHTPHTQRRGGPAGCFYSSIPVDAQSHASPNYEV